MEELTLRDYWQQWTNWTADREAARQEAQGSVGSALEDELREKKLQAAQLKADIYQLQARIAMAKGSYSKPAFDAEWIRKKAELKAKIEELVAIELGKGKNPNQIAGELGSRSLSFFYAVKSHVDVYRETARAEIQSVKWHWSRFTGTQRYALDDKYGQANYVLMKGTLDTELEGEECVWDFVTGVFVSGSEEVYNSDTEANRRKRADTLDEILTGTYSGQVKERKNPYFEKVD